MYELMCICKRRFRNRYIWPTKNKLILDISTCTEETCNWDKRAYITKMWFNSRLGVRFDELQACGTCVLCTLHNLIVSDSHVINQVWKQSLMFTILISRLLQKWISGSKYKAASCYWKNLITAIRWKKNLFLLAFFKWTCLSNNKYCFGFGNNWALLKKLYQKPEKKTNHKNSIKIFCQLCGNFPQWWSVATSAKWNSFVHFWHVRNYDIVIWISNKQNSLNKEKESFH